MFRAFHEARGKAKLQRFKEMVSAYAMQQHGLHVDTNTDPIVFHQRLWYRGLMTLLVVPWPDSNNYALNEKDHKLRGSHYDQVLFGRIRLVNIPKDKALLDLHQAFTLPALEHLLKGCGLRSGKWHGPFWLILTGKVE